MNLTDRIKNEWKVLDRICDFVIDAEGRVTIRNKEKDLSLKEEYGTLQDILSVAYLFFHPAKMIKALRYVMQNPINP